MKRLRRAASLAAASSLAVAGLGAATVVTSSPAAAADHDPVALHRGADWLVGQLHDGLLPSPYGGDDVGLTIDAGFGLLAEGEHGDDLDTVVSGVAGALDGYVGDYSYTSPDPYPDGPEATFAGHSSNATAKAASFALAVGEDPQGFGGHDLVDDLEDMVQTDAPVAGRLSDEPTKDGEPYPAGDYASTLGQAFAVNALDAVDSPLAADATQFLLDQQCDDGYFRNGFAAPDAADQTCGTGTANTDATALAVLNLQSQLDDPDVAAAVADAVSWLEDSQDADGSWGSEAPTDTPNANSTGLAGWALGESGETEAAELAATWVRAHQADDPTGRVCATGLAQQTGAVAYDDAGLEAGRADGITADTGDQFRRATAQALPALQWAPAAGVGDVVTVTPGFARAGSRVDLAQDGLAPGDTICFKRGKDVVLAAAGRNGQALGAVRLPAGTGDRTYRAVSGEEVVGSVAYTGLDRTRLGLAMRHRRAAGAKQRVVVSGLQPDEPATVRYRGKVVGRETANAQGKVAAVFRVGRRPGRQKVVAVGLFADRRGADRFRVVR